MTDEDEDESLLSLRDGVKRQTIQRDNKRCRNCGVDEKLVVDSVVPFRNGGNRNTENLVTLCKSCKNSKYGKKEYYNRDYPDNWGEFSQQVYQRDNYTCQNCGLSGGSERHGDAVLNAHHIVPKSVGGNDTISNCVTLCSDCHGACHDHMSSSLESITKREQSTTNSEDSETGTQTTSSVATAQVSNDSADFDDSDTLEDTDDEFTGTVVQAGDPIILDNGSETRQFEIEIDVELRLGEEVTVRGIAEDGIIKAEQIDGGSEKSTTEHGQTNTNLEDNGTGSQTTSTNECLSCGSAIDWGESNISCRDCYSSGGVKNSNSKAEYSEASDDSKYSSKHAKYRRKDVNTQTTSSGGTAQTPTDSTDSGASPTFEDTDDEFTGTVVQAGDPIILDNGSETRLFETDAELRLGEEVTVRPIAEDGIIAEGEIIKVEQIDGGSEKSTTEHGQSTTDSQNTTNKNGSTDQKSNNQRTEEIINIIGVIIKKDPRIRLRTTNGENYTQYDIRIGSDTQIDNNVDLDVGEAVTVRGMKKGELIHAHDLY
jgi:5-methylcytosine-specific restriction endonuclease McrA